MAEVEGDYFCNLYATCVKVNTAPFIIACIDYNVMQSPVPQAMRSSRLAQ